MIKIFRQLFILSWNQVVLRKVVGLEFLNGAGGAGVNMVGNGRAFSYEVDGMSMEDERY